MVGSDILELKIRLLRNPFAITRRSALIVFKDLSGLGLLRSGSLTRITKLINSYVAKITPGHHTSRLCFLLIALCYFKTCFTVFPKKINVLLLPHP